MRADEITPLSMLRDQFDDHVRKCDRRQEVLHGKISHLEKVVYVGVGILMVLEVLSYGLIEAVVK